MKKQPFHPDTALLLIIGIVLFVCVLAFAFAPGASSKGSLAVATGNVVWSHEPIVPAYEGRAILSTLGDYAQCVDCLARS